MKRTIAGLLLLVGMSAGTMFASNGYWRDRHEIRRDEVGIAHDRRELRHDIYHGNYEAARHERRDLRRDYCDFYWIAGKHSAQRRELGSSSVWWCTV